jgi:hypothetical protein
MAARQDEVISRQSLKDDHAQQLSTRSFFQDEDTNTMLRSFEALQQSVEGLKSMHSNDSNNSEDLDQLINAEEDVFCGEGKTLPNPNMSAHPDRRNRTVRAEYDDTLSNSDNMTMHTVDLASTRNVPLSPTKKMKVCVSRDSDNDNEESTKAGESSAAKLVEKAHQAIIECGARKILEQFLYGRIKLLWRQTDIDRTGIKDMSEEDLINQWIDELLRYLTLKTMAGDIGIPCRMPASAPIDEAWMGLMIIPSAYAKVCSALGSETVIDRDPAAHQARSKSETSRLHVRFNTTLRAYTQNFWQDPSEIFWPDPSIQFDYISYFSSTVTSTFNDIVAKVNEDDAAGKLFPDEIKRFFKSCTARGQTMSPTGEYESAMPKFGF